MKKSRLQGETDKKAVTKKFKKLKTATFSKIARPKYANNVFYAHISIATCLNYP